MAGLDDLNSSSPAGNSLLSGGDDAIRLVITKLIEAYTLEHAGSGAHSFPVGTIAARPSYGLAGRFYVLTVAGVAAELQYDTGSEWVTLTTNQAMIDYADALVAHATAAVIDHPNGSITSPKIASGQILKKHLMGGVSTDSLATLVNGEKADGLHTHTWDAISGVSGVTDYLTAGAHILTVPEGVVRMFFTLIGGGGAGFTGLFNVGGGGGAAGTTVYNYAMTVTPGAELALLVGSGGIGNKTGVVTPGQNTTVEGLPYVAYGGAGGSSPAGGVVKTGMLPSGSGGTGGQDTFGTDFYPAAGEGPFTWYPGGVPGDISLIGGGGGGSTLWGSGGRGGQGTGTPAGHGASASGAGGGGGSGQQTYIDSYGGNGGSGRIIVSW